VNLFNNYWEGFKVREKNVEILDPHTPAVMWKNTTYYFKTKLKFLDELDLLRNVEIYYFLLISFFSFFEPFKH